MSHYIILGIFALTGSISLLASLCNWEWFFTAHNSQFIVSYVGRRMARWIYGILGGALIGMAFYLATLPQ